MTPRRRRGPVPERRPAAPPPRALRRRNRAWWPFGGAKAAKKHCHTSKDCGDPQQYCCDREAEECIRRDRMDAPRRCARSDFFEPPAKAKTGAAADGLAVIDGTPGRRGFNAEVRKALRSRQITATMTCERGAQRDQAHQLLLRHLVHGESTVRRLLVAWTPGTGKTRAMIRVLENLYDDPSPKLILFPTQALVDNFYEEFIRVDNRYMHRWRKRFPDVENPYEGVDEAALDEAGWVALNRRRDLFRQRIRSFMEMWPVPLFNNPFSGLAAPLRAFTMEQAGAAAFPTENKVLNWPGGDANKRTERCATGGGGGTGALFSQAGTRVCSFDRTIVIVDEAHNLFFPAASAVVKPGADIERLRTRLYEAHGSVVVFFTATPVLTGDAGVDEARAVLRFVKGHEFRDADTDEGFVSWYMDRPREVFATTRPPRLADLVVQDAAPNLYRVFINRGAAGGGSGSGSGTPWSWRQYVHLRYGEPAPRAWQHAAAGGDGDGDGAPSMAYDPATRKHYLLTDKPSAPAGAKKTVAAAAVVVAPPKKPKAAAKPKAATKPKPKPKPKPASGGAAYGDYVFAAAPPKTKWTLPMPLKKKKQTAKKTKKKRPGKPAPHAAASHGSFRSGRLRSPADDGPRAASHGDKCVATDRCDALWSIHEHLWFDPRVTPEADAILAARLTPENATDLAPKLAAIAQSVRDDGLKTLILIHESYGALVLWHLLREHGVDSILLRRPGAGPGQKKPKAAGAGDGDGDEDGGAFPPPATTFYNWKRLLAFNAANNLSGKKYRVAVAVVEEFGEGVSFLGVRRVIIASLSGVGEKPRWPLVQQWIARALRMCSHEDLKAELRTLTVDLFVASSDHGRYRKTLDEQRLDFLREEISGVNAGMELLRRAAIDEGMYEPAKGWFSWLRWK